MKKVWIVFLATILTALVAIGCDGTDNIGGATEITLGKTFKTVYYEGEDLDVSGGKLTVKTGTESKEVDITADMVTGFDSETVGEKSLTVSLTENGTEYSVSVKINVIGLSSVKVTKQPDKTVYYIGEKFLKEGTELTAVYADETEKVVSGFTAADTAFKLGDIKTTLTYRNKTADVGITVMASPFTDTDTGISFAVGDDELKFVQLDAYNHSVPVSLNGVKSLSLKADVTDEQKAAGAELTYIVYTNDGTLEYMMNFDQNLELNVGELNGLSQIAAFIKCDSFMLSKTTTLEFVHYDEGKVFDGSKFEGVYANDDDSLRIIIRKSIGDRYEVLLPNASENVLLGGTSYRQTWTEFNKDRVNYLYDSEYELTKIKLNLHANRSVDFVLDIDAGILTAASDGKYRTSAGEATVFNAGEAFAKVNPRVINAKNEAELNQAIADAKEGETVRLTADINLNRYVLIEKNIVLDGGGHTLNGANITDEQNFRKHIISVQSAKATVKNITLSDGDRSGVNIVGGGANLINVNIRDCRLNGVIVNSSNLFMDNVRIDGNRDGAIDLSPKYATASVTLTDSCRLDSDYQILQMDVSFTATVNLPDSYESEKLEVATGVFINHWFKAAA